MDDESGELMELVEEVRLGLISGLGWVSRTAVQVRVGYLNHK